MIKTDVLIIGGSASGLATAISGKTTYPEKDFLLVRKEEKVMVPCGIPYMFGSLETNEKNVMPTDAAYDKVGVKHKVGEISAIDKDRKLATLADGEEISFDKLVIATGSTPTKPKWLKGADLEQVYVIPKDKVYLDKMKEEMACCKKIAVIGGGFIGVELSDELNKQDNDVSLIEIRDTILTAAFGKELATRAQDVLQERGVKILTGKGIAEINGKDGKASSLTLEDGTALDVDAVVLAMGYSPNSGLGKNAGLQMARNNFIWVDEYMRTDHPDIFAVGDCAEKRNFITRRQTPTMLASTACAEGRIAGMNLFRTSAIKTFSGTIAIYSTVIGEHAFGTAGITETDARQEGFDVVAGMGEGIDRHPGSLPGAHKQIVKLTVARESGVIIGGEAYGGSSIGELTNLLGLIIQSRTNIHTLQTMQIGTHPMLTASPAAYPLVKAAGDAVAKMK